MEWVPDFEISRTKSSKQRPPRKKLDNNILLHCMGGGIKVGRIYIIFISTMSLKSSSHRNRNQGNNPRIKTHPSRRVHLNEKPAMWFFYNFSMLCSRLEKPSKPPAEGKTPLPPSFEVIPSPLYPDAVFIGSRLFLPGTFPSCFSNIYRPFSRQGRQCRWREPWPSILSAFAAKEQVMGEPAVVAAVSSAETEQLLTVIPGRSHHSSCARAAEVPSPVLSLVLTWAEGARHPSSWYHLSHSLQGPSVRSLHQILACGPVSHTKCRATQARIPTWLPSDFSSPTPFFLRLGFA